MAMRKWLGLLLGLLMLSVSCGTAAAVVLIGALLNDAAPTRVVSGTVSLADATPAIGVLVQMKASIVGDDDTIVESDSTDAVGAYSIKFKWHGDVSYTIRVVNDQGLELYNENLGQIEKTDFQKDIVLP